MDMNIILSPQRRDDTLTVVKHGETLTINGVEYNFSAVPDGANWPVNEIDCQWIASDVERIDGVLHITLILPLAADASGAACFPAPLMNAVDGQLELPK